MGATIWYPSYRLSADTSCAVVSYRPGISRVSLLTTPLALRLLRAGT